MRAQLAGYLQHKRSVVLQDKRMVSMLRSAIDDSKALTQARDGVIFWQRRGRFSHSL